ncbi:GGDEF domain-containing protein [Vibrio sp.]|uniref:GGDEF domain-containing protein n=1 Tax=Vibrio sp. TaxID=678 RepID=UPI003D0BD20F
MANKPTPLPSVLLRAKSLLIVLSALLILANLYLLSATRELAKSFTNSQYQATWFMFQLNKEFSELVAITPYSADNPAEKEQTWLKFELTWSRFDVMLNSQESADFVALEGTREFLSTLFRRFSQLEPELQAVNDSQSAEQLAKKFELIYQDMVAYVNENFRNSSPLYLEQLSHAKRLTQAQYLFLFMLIASVALVSYILHKESQYHCSLALTDPLTNAANRLALIKHLKAQVDRQKPFSLLLIDLDGFKHVNDSYGHIIGDSALKEISKRFNDTVQKHFRCSLYRIGGDEFSVICPSVESAQVDRLINELFRCFEKPIELTNDSSVNLSMSVGVSRFPEDSLDFNQLISIADHQMYEMKFRHRACGKSGLRVNQ